ncbi:Aspartyl/asparaginyl beta-hydroxylase [Camelus dromedarius]|uniref:Aspartyl/asparaginyl beta-hydroxylase n=1 Tax=Camelus dromedarius TaxID=9838 RepID=A0A5N4CCE7_CAMDR|nr:Aspartyl/asparaginyl beta-hydroxylase [Camelus dromedarius]
MNCGLLRRIWKDVKAGGEEGVADSFSECLTVEFALEEFSLTECIKDTVNVEPGSKMKILRLILILEERDSYKIMTFVRLFYFLTEAKHGGQKNGKKGGLSGSSFFTWFMVIALLGVWTSVAVVWFDLVDYEEVLAKAKDFRYNLSEVLQGKLGIYDADGDGDFDVDDAKVLLGKYTFCLTKDGSNENIDSLEEVLNILAEESSDWFYGFLSFLYDIMTPFEMLEEEEEESETADGVDGTSQNEGVQGKTCVILDLHNQ